MIEIKMTVQGVKEFKQALRAAPQKAADELGTAVHAAAQAVENAAKHEAPVNKAGGGGNLRQNIRSRMAGKLRGYVEALSSYAIFVHEGTRPHVIRPRGKKALSFPWTKGGFQAGQSGGEIAFVKPGMTRNNRIQYHGNVVLGAVHHPGTRPNPFFDRAIERSRNQVDGIFKAALERIAAFIAK